MVPIKESPLFYVGSGILNKIITALLLVKLAALFRAAIFYVLP